MNHAKVGPTRATVSPCDLLASFAKRKDALKKKAHELATRCATDVAVVFRVPGGAGRHDCWPSNEATKEVLRRYSALAPANRAKHTEDVAALVARQLAEEREKLVRAREGGVALALGSRDGSLEGLSEGKLRELLAAIEGSQVDAKNRILQLQAPAPLGGAVDHATLSPGLVHEDEATEKDTVPATDNGVPPRGEPAAGGGGLGPPPSKTPNSRNADMPVDKDDGDEVRILQPPSDADAEWMRGLVGDLKKMPQPYDPAAYAAWIEYIHVGWWSMMERDAYDFIRFDLMMPPPCIAPMDDDEEEEPLKLWSWDNTMPLP